MPISHKSYIHQPIGYTTPVDLNLLGKVLQFKQGQYDVGVAKTQQAIDSVASLDVVRDIDKQYLNSKLNNLVTTINNIGGADFSDPNITNQIAGLSSQIYSDPNIIGAVANTKKFRYTQQYYKDLKEKKPKDWNPANEWYDINKFSGWLNDQRLGTSPEANAGNVTPYSKYEEDWQKMFDKVVQSANIKTEITDKGLMYRLDTYRYVSPERIWEAASKMLNPLQRGQIGIEGRYTYNALPISELTKAYDQQTYNKVAEAQEQLVDYRSKLKGSTDIGDQESYQKLITEKEAEINRLLAPVRKGSEQIKENLYLNQKLTGLQARYAFTQATTKLQPAQDKMFKLKYELDKQEFAYKQQNDALNREADLAKEGMRMITDMFGNRTFVRDPKLAKPKAGDDDVTYTNFPGLNNAMDAQTNVYTKDVLDTQKEELVKANNTLFQDFVRDLGRKKGLSDVIITDLMDDGNIQAVVDPEIRKSAQQMMSAWNAMTRGEKINYEQLDPLFKSFAGRYQENQKEIEAIDKFYENVDKQVKAEYSITPQIEQAVIDRDRLQQRAAQLAQEYFSKGYLDSGAGADAVPDAQRIRSEQIQIANRIAQIDGTIGKGRMNDYLTNRTSRRNELIASSDKVFNLQNVTLSDDKKKNLAKGLASNAGTLQYYSENGEPIAKKTLNFDNVEIMNAGYAYLNSGEGMTRQPTVTVKIKTGTGAEDFEIARIPLTPTQQQVLGFGRDIMDAKGYNAGLTLNGEVNNINTTAGMNYQLKYDVVKYQPDDNNNPTVFIRVKKDNNVISLYNRPFSTYEQAIQFMESASRLKNIDEAYKYLTDLAK